MPINPRLALAVFCLLVTALFIGGAQPGAGELFPPPWDKVAHVSLYATLTFLLGLAFPSLRLPLLALVILIVGGSDELHQIFVPGRHPGLDDLAADAAGCLPAMALLSLLRRRDSTTV